MKDCIENTPRVEAQDDIIVLGVASVETKGDLGGTELPGNGQMGAPGITDE